MRGASPNLAVCALRLCADIMAAFLGHSGALAEQGTHSACGFSAHNNRSVYPDFSWVQVGVSILSSAFCLT